MRVAASKETTLQCFELAFVFLTQTFPNLTISESASSKSKEETSQFSDKLKYLEHKLEDQERKMTDIFQQFEDQIKDCDKNQKDYHDKLNAGLNRITTRQENHEATLAKKLEEYDGHLGDIQKKIKKQVKTTEMLNKTVISNAEKVLGLQKLRKLFSNMLKTATTTSPTSTAVSAAATSSVIVSATLQANDSTATTLSSSQTSACAVASRRGPPKSLRQRKMFSAKVSEDIKEPSITDVKLLPGGLVLLADYENHSVKLFNSQGQHLHIHRIDGCPSHIAVMDITSLSGWDVAVSVPEKQRIDFLKVNYNSLSLKNSIYTPSKCSALTAVDTKILAVCSDDNGINLIDKIGTVLRHLSFMKPKYMDIMPSEERLVISVHYSTFSEISLNGGIYRRHRIEEISYMEGISCHQDGSFIAIDSSTDSSAHLLNACGSWVKKLWYSSYGDLNGDRLKSVSVMNEECIICSEKGSVFVFDINYD
ncbi:hypothetical protein ElyMa_006704800 [Elysia marginata]|uniref:Uncharacterized protein n=1 Tax=Elysia marginata TaxID=1093978 RepID=A0AAV4IQV5_9GAST|nr:hypothetical protein ElyMa_006704800 [Elysia marginata]